MSELKYNHKKHRYTVDGVKYRSVTEVVGSYFPEFDSKAIAKKLASYPINKQRKQGVRYWLKKWKLQQEYGSAVHNAIDEVLCGESDGDLSDEVQAAIDFIHIEYSQYEHVIMTSEYKLHSDLYRVAGTCDLLVNYCINDIWYTDIIDWKVTKEITKENKYDKNINTLGFPNANYWKYSLQLNMYAYLLSKNGTRINKLKIVHLVDNIAIAHEVPAMFDRIDIILREVQNENKQERKI